ncbi:MULTISPECIES: hypothetical protein [Brevibacillus]|uniref:hypothetical protein n=1 Tax=Brevibacillus TaxID=55080 RepID=UPI000271CBD9|nr:MULTISPECIES: hypothetical protein [Brevibacillus]EJL47509.1 hypothetical protein PMI08_00316 [Brevibacillus sp. CF112]MBG9566603.1 hypothetical protein [Brevibacillus agri]MBY0054177.1 hypothetical protein [Brevibacillus agri]MCG5252008.1 hypothetical protein [Brevibacillus agri]MDN4094936.1 hypothetical protein [Brevibacillus agri]
MKKYVAMCCLSVVYTFFGEMLVFLLADPHALGDTTIYHFLKNGYYIMGFVIVVWTVKVIYRKGFHRNKKELVLDYAIYAVMVMLAYTCTNIVIDTYFAHLV